VNKEREGGGSPALLLAHARDGARPGAAVAAALPAAAAGRRCGLAGPRPERLGGAERSRGRHRGAWGGSGWCGGAHGGLGGGATAQAATGRGGCEAGRRDGQSGRADPARVVARCWAA